MVKFFNINTGLNKKGLTTLNFLGLKGNPIFYPDFFYRGVNLFYTYLVTTEGQKVTLTIKYCNLAKSLCYLFFRI